MGLLTSALGRFSQSPNYRSTLYKIPPYLSLLLLLGGLTWIFLLPLQQYSRKTYVSENALLPGQVHTYFGGSEQNVFRAYRQELKEILAPYMVYVDGVPQSEEPFYKTQDEKSAKVVELFRNAGLTKTAKQKYSYISSGKKHEGENVYAIIHAPRGDGTEAIVLVASLKNIEDRDNANGAALLISLARYFKRWSLWSKDIIFLITPDSTSGPQAWIDAYHSTHDARAVQALSLKSGALQGAVCIDYPQDERFSTFHVAYDGVNGQLPNLDLFNTAVSIASGQMGIGTSLQKQHTFTQHDKQDEYPVRLQTLARGMASQALGAATGPHSVFMPYHIDAITLTALGSGGQDEMAFGRTIESICRSLNNLLEKLHQSFFFYLLMQSNRFVSIGDYLPSAMAIAASYTIMAIFLWVKAGYIEIRPPKPANITISNEKVIDLSDKSDEEIAALLNPNSSTKPPAETKYIPTPRDLILPLGILTIIQAASSVPLYILTHSTLHSHPQLFILFTLFTIVSPLIIAAALPEMPNNTFFPAIRAPTESQYTLLNSISLLVLGLFLTVLATLNFSLSTFLGLACVPICFVRRRPRSLSPTALQYLVLLVMSPPAAGLAVAGWNWYMHGKTDELWIQLENLAYAWNVNGSWGVVVGLCCVWWPAWVISAVGVASSWFVPDRSEEDRKLLERRTTSEKDDLHKATGKTTTTGAIREKTPTTSRTTQPVESETGVRSRTSPKANGRGR